MRSFTIANGVMRKAERVASDLPGIVEQLKQHRVPGARLKRLARQGDAADGLAVEDVEANDWVIVIGKC